MSMRASAARYAKALLDVTLTEASPEQAEQDLAGFLTLVQQHPELERTLSNPVVPAASKVGIVTDLLKHVQVSTPVSKLLRLLAERDRLVLLPDLLDVYRERLREHRRVINAEVTTAVPLSADHTEQLRQRLMAATGQTVTMTTTVDPSIIGGVVTRIGSTVYDGSVARQLASLRQRLESR